VRTKREEVNFVRTSFMDGPLCIILSFHESRAYSIWTWRRPDAYAPPGSSGVGLYLEMGPLIRLALLPKQFYKL